jgi:hypothetical protein
LGQSGIYFDYPDASYLVIQLYTVVRYLPDDPVLFITVASDRDHAIPATVPHPADWPISTATEIAADLLPIGTTFGQLSDTIPGALSATCTSEALEQAFGVVGQGACRATYQLSSNDTVSFVTLSLVSSAGASRNDGSPEPSCTGLVEWAAGSAERLETAQALLDCLANLSADPAIAVPDLRSLAEDLSVLADEQRSADTPREVATANYYIIGALTDFSAAMALAADGFEQGDQAIVDDAVDDLDRGDERVARATTEIKAAVAGCDLTIGTPAPNA